MAWWGSLCTQQHATQLPRPVLEHRLLLVRKQLTSLEQNASIPEVSLVGLWKFCSGESSQCWEHISLQCCCSARASC